VEIRLPLSAPDEKEEEKEEEVDHVLPA
jgi:hypothetical protein